MPLSPRALKAMSGAGAVTICTISAVLVAIDAKPAAAPLRPTLRGDVSTPQAGLLIPPSCGRVATGSGAVAPSIDASLLPLVRQVQQATTAAQRRAILAPLTSQQRLAIDAYVSAARRDAVTCAGSGSNAGGTIAPSVVNGSPPGAPLTNTYVS